jgi:hypothetical protein
VHDLPLMIVKKLGAVHWHDQLGNMACLIQIQGQSPGNIS